jgi:hypothetical protein
MLDFVLLLAAFILLALATWVAEPKLAKLLPAGLAVWVLDALIKAWPG